MCEKGETCVEGLEPASWLNFGAAFRLIIILFFWSCPLTRRIVCRREKSLPVLLLR